MKKHPHINAEAFHASILASIRNYAKAVAPKGNPVSAVILEPTGMDRLVDADDEGDDPYEKLMEMIWSIGDEGIAYQCHGSFSLPPESASLVFMMARCMLVCPLPTTEIKDYDGMKELPFETFALGELLSAGYPRNTRTGIIKGTVGAAFIDGYEPDDKVVVDDIVVVDDMAEEVSLHRRFAGVCVTIMDETRKALGELMEDDEVIRVATEKELVLCLVQS